MFKDWLNLNCSDEVYHYSKHPMHKPKFKVGDRVQVKGKGHGAMQMNGKVGLVYTEPVYAIYFDDNPKKLHKWYAQEEIKSEE